MQSLFPKIIPFCKKEGEAVLTLLLCILYLWFLLALLQSSLQKDLIFLLTSSFLLFFLPLSLYVWRRIDLVERKRKEREVLEEFQEKGKDIQVLLELGEKENEQLSFLLQEEVILTQEKTKEADALQESLSLLEEKERDQEKSIQEAIDLLGISTQIVATLQTRITTLGKEQKTFLSSLKQQEKLLEKAQRELQSSEDERDLLTNQVEEQESTLEGLRVSLESGSERKIALLEERQREEMQALEKIFIEIGERFQGLDAVFYGTVDIQVAYETMQQISVYLGMISSFFSGRLPSSALSERLDQEIEEGFEEGEENPFAGFPLPRAIARSVGQHPQGSEGAPRVNPTDWVAPPLILDDSPPPERKGKTQRLRNSL